MRVADALALAETIGMFQQAKEIHDFAEWLAARRPHHVIEIGTLKGGTAALWHSLCSGRVVTVDLPNGRFGGADHGLTDAVCARRNLDLNEQFTRILPIVGRSQDASTVLAVKHALWGELADVLFIDGDHTLPGVATDFFHYSQLVKPGGVIAFHDVLDTPMHREHGCFVHVLWENLVATSGMSSLEFVCNGPWGGIGVLIK